MKFLSNLEFWPDLLQINRKYLEEIRAHPFIMYELLIALVIIHFLFNLKNWQ